MAAAEAPAGRDEFAGQVGGDSLAGISRGGDYNRGDPVCRQCLRGTLPHSGAQHDIATGERRQDSGVALLPAAGMEMAVSLLVRVVHQVRTRLAALDLTILNLEYEETLTTAKVL